MRRLTLVLAAACSLCPMPRSALAASATADSARVRRLMDDGQRRWSMGTLGQRRIALRAFAEAAQVAPRDVRVLGTLGRAYLDALFLRDARMTFERVLVLAPGDADAEFGLGQTWARTWLDLPDTSAMTAAIRHFEAATAGGVHACDAWTSLVALHIERGDVAAAQDAAASALRADPSCAKAQLAVAELAYRGGEVERADSLFAIAIPRLGPALRTGFADLSPLLAADEADRYGELNPDERQAAARRFWALNDPDPTTPANEARVEFWSRLAHAALLFGDPWNPHWQFRTELYARYGRRVQHEDPLGGTHHEIPNLDWGEVPETPTPRALARLGQRTTADGQAVFAPLPPGVRALAVTTLLARFESERGPRLLAQLETPGSPADSLSGTCVVLDSTGREAGRASRALAAGACDPARSRTADFAFELPSGRYRVTFAVRDGRNGRGVAQSNVILPQPAAQLALSDLVLNCGAMDPATSQGGVRLNPDLQARIGTDEPLHAYFEVYHLRADTKGATRFDYEYTVQSADPDRRPWYRRVIPGGPPTLLSYHSDQQGVGTLRRQFINVPAGSLGYGRYRLTITVHDQQAGTKSARSVEFDKLPAPRGGKGRR